MSDHARRMKAIHEADQANARKRDERAASSDGMTASERAMQESLIERGARMADVLAEVGRAFIGDRPHVERDCNRIDALAMAALHKIGRDQAAQVAEHVRAGLAQCMGLGSATADDAGGYDKFGRIAYASVSLAIELGVQAVSAGLGAKLLDTDGDPSPRLLRADQVAMALAAAVDGGFLADLPGLAPAVAEALDKWRKEVKAT